MISSRTKLKDRSQPQVRPFIGFIALVAFIGIAFLVAKPEGARNKTVTAQLPENTNVEAVAETNQVFRFTNLHVSPIFGK